VPRRHDFVVLSTKIALPRDRGWVNGWSPYLSLEDARELDAVRDALRGGDIATASASARVFSLTM
jgi:hypothetical protein